MSSLAGFFALAAVELAGLFVIWFLIKAKVRRYLELESLLAGVRDEARALVLELNETADRSVTLVEDRMLALRDLLDEVDRRMGVERKMLETREVEREVYAKLNRRRPIVPSAERPIVPSAERPIVPSAERPIVPSAERPVAPTTASDRIELGGAAALPEGAAKEAPIRLSLGSSDQSPEATGRAPEVVFSESPVAPMKSQREEALDLYRHGFSAQLIAARTGSTVAEIELLIELEERRAAVKGRFD